VTSTVSAKDFQRIPGGEIGRAYRTGAQAKMLGLTATQLTDPGKGLPLLVVGPSIGTSVTALWSSCAHRLAGRFHVVGWDLPGHGRSATTDEPFAMADLAAAVVTLVDRLRASAASGPVSKVFYAGDSVGGAVGLQSLLDGRV